MDSIDNIINGSTTLYISFTEEYGGLNQIRLTVKGIPRHAREVANQLISGYEKSGIPANVSTIDQEINKSTLYWKESSRHEFAR